MNDCRGERLEVGQRVTFTAPHLSPDHGIGVIVDIRCQGREYLATIASDTIHCVRGVNFVGDLDSMVLITSRSEVCERLEVIRDTHIAMRAVRQAFRR